MASVHGLTTAQAEESRRIHGENILTPPPHKSVWRLAAEKLAEPLILILALAAAVSILTGGVVEGAGILLAILLSAGIGFLSEYRAGRAFDILNRTGDGTPVRVFRDGGLVSIPKNELVPGDLIRLETGEEIPADCTVVKSSGFEVDQSKFTGEPEPVPKLPENDPGYAELLAEGGTYPPHRALRGSSVLAGSADLLATETGMATELGKTARAATEITDETTPLQKQLSALSKVIAVFGISLSVLLFLTLIFLHWHAGNLTFSVFLNAFMIGVTLIVVTVPEGLPMSVTLSLACSMRKMAASNCLIRRLHATETLGCATVICTDKTGTLTMNRMTLAESFFPADAEDLRREAFILNSTASPGADGKILGNPTEGALLSSLPPDADVSALREKFPAQKQWNFSTETKFMAVLAKNGRLHLKGAPEIVLAKCSARRAPGGKVEPIGDSVREDLLRAFRAEQAKGRRTLAFAYSDTENSPDGGNFVYLGFVSIADPVRPEVPEAVRACRKAGIRVKIVTGDTPATAAEIAKEIGLGEGSVIEGRAFEALGPEETRKVSSELSVIARARPADKQKLVKTLQAMGEVAAVTGDGTNDAPALHHADVGIAMGVTGTAIAREAADVILLDDSFRSIVSAVLWGRSLYLNIQKFLVFQLTVNAAAAGIALAGPFIGIEMPFTVIQMLWINLIMDTFAALALSTEPPEPEVMNRPPRKPGAFIVTKPMAYAIFGTALFFILAFFAAAGYLKGKEHGLSLLFSGFVLLQVWNLCNVRALGTNRSMIAHPPKNKVFLAVAGGIVAVQVVITQYGGAFFRTAPLSLREWAVLIGATSIVFLFGELFRLLRRLR